jgi:hypothetical protein
MDETIALVQRYFQPGDTELTVIEEGFSTPRLVMPAAGQGGLPRHTHLGLAQLEQLAQAQEPWLWPRWTAA